MESRYSSGFGWIDARWYLLDISSGPPNYETMGSEFTNFIEYYDGSADETILTNELTILTRAVTFSSFVPTYVYEPIWAPDVQLCISVFHDGNFTLADNLNLNKIETSFHSLFPFSNISIITHISEIEDNDEVDQYLDYIQDFTDYSTWASKLIEFINLKEEDHFGDYDRNETLRLLGGVFATSRLTGPSELSLGYTYGYLGSNVPLGSVVTLTPATSQSIREGYTQTLIHEFGHSIGLRHPHDFRFDGNLYKIWTWDIAETPLAYFHSVYDFSYLDRDVFFRGNYRHLYNFSLESLERINHILSDKNFPENCYPSTISDLLLNTSSHLDISIQTFRSLNYEDSLFEILKGVRNIKTIFKMITEINNYFEPVLNFNNVNNSVIDYGSVLEFSGNSITFEFPNISIIEGYRETFAILNSTKNYLGQFESFFSLFISSNFLGDPDTESSFFIFVNDGVLKNTYIWTVFLEQLKISILTPSNDMFINLEEANYIPLYGRYRSGSINSNISIIYGSYWYVKDRENNMSYWMSVNKTSGNDWFYNANLTNFVDGSNLILVKIKNELASSQDNITVNIVGLDDLDPTSTTSEFNPSTPNNTSSILNGKIIDPPFTLQLIILSVSLIVFYTGGKQLINKRRKDRIINTNIDRLPSHKKSLSELSTALSKKEKQLQINNKSTLHDKNSKKPPILRRRR